MNGRLSEDERPRWLARDRRNGWWVALYSANEAALPCYDRRRGPYSRQGACVALANLNGPREAAPPAPQEGGASCP